jgi:hypothetical protein
MIGIGGDYLSDTGGRYIGEAIVNNTTLKTLYLSTSSLNYIDNNSLQDNGVRLIAEALKHNKTLVTLSLCN